MQPKGFISKVLQQIGAKSDPYNAFQTPIYANGAYSFASAEEMEMAFTGRMAAHMYSRSSNPTSENLELRIKSVTGAFGVLALSSGMAAITNVFITLCKAGDNVITSNHLFGNTWSLFAHTLAPYGLETRFCDLTDIEAVKAQITNKTKAIFFETVTNPQCEVCDIAALAALAKEYNIPLIADTTMTPPHIFKAREWGINIEIISSSKIISGGGTSIGGVVIDYGTYDWSSSEKLQASAAKFGQGAFYARLRKEVYRNMGACMSPFNAYLQALGLESMPLRYNRCAGSAVAIAEFLEKHPKVAAVNHPALASSPYNELSKKQFGDLPTAVFSFSLKSREACFTFLNNLKLISIATNLMDNRTLCLHPGSTIYSEYTAQQREEMHVPDTLIRITIGLEEAEDLLADIAQALNTIK